jgi:hypothetical protein
MSFSIRGLMWPFLQASCSESLCIYWGETYFITKQIKCRVCSSMIHRMNCPMICVSTWITVALYGYKCNIFVVIYVDDLDTPVCCEIQASYFLWYVSNLEPVLSSFSIVSVYVCMFSFCQDLNLLLRTFFMFGTCTLGNVHLTLQKCFV